MSVAGILPIIINLMAFVFRSEKPQHLGKPNPNVGPGKTVLI